MNDIRNQKDVAFQFSDFQLSISLPLIQQLNVMFGVKWLNISKVIGITHDHDFYKCSITPEYMVYVSLKSQTIKFASTALSPNETISHISFTIGSTQWVTCTGNENLNWMQRMAFSMTYPVKSRYHNNPVLKCNLKINLVTNKCADGNDVMKSAIRAQCTIYLLICFYTSNRCRVLIGTPRPDRCTSTQDEATGIYRHLPNDSRPFWPPSLTSEQLLTEQSP